MNSILHKHAGEVARNIRNHSYEQNDSGILVPSMGVFIGGALKATNYGDGSVQEMAIDANTLLNEGLNHILNVTLPPAGGYAQITQWYIAPFSGNYTPDKAALTAATFPASATEFEDYTNATRPTLTIAAATSTQATGNSGAEAQYVMGAGGPFNIYGFVIVSSSAKGAVTGKALAGVRLDNPMLNLVTDYKAGAEYVITAADAG